MYSESTLRKKAAAAGYSIEKGFQHYHNGTIVTNWNGERFTGYNVKNLATGFYEWGCYDNNYDHLWQLEDVEEFLKKIYLEHDMKW